MTTDTIFATITVKVPDDAVKGQDAQTVWTDFVTQAFAQYLGNPESCPIVGIMVRSNPPTEEEAADDVAVSLSSYEAMSNE